MGIPRSRNTKIEIKKMDKTKPGSLPYDFMSFISFPMFIKNMAAILIGRID